MILVDTSVWIEYFNGVETKQTKQLDAFLENEIIIIGDIILAEILQGFKNDKDFEIAKQVLTNFESHTICNQQIAIQSAEYYRLLRKSGVTVRKTIDMLIGTFCIKNNIPLLQNDRDFIPLRKFGLMLL